MTTGSLSGRRGQMSDLEGPDHHGSHRNLLWSAGRLSAAKQDLDAIIVPTTRPPAALVAAASLARKLGCPLVTLHSKNRTSAASAMHRLPADIDLIAIDVPGRAQLNLPAMESSRLPEGALFARRTDLAVKRNLALTLGHMVNWSRVLFLDDDITGLNPADMRDASGLLNMYNVVGLLVDGMPDHSVVCHAYRRAGGDQNAFVGGGAMAVALDRIRSFFPDIYNDDWFFMLDGKGGLQPATRTGKVIQSFYDPFQKVSRARNEEFGDVLAEGIYWLLDQGQSVFEADEEYWAAFLRKRRQFIGRVLEMVRDQDLTAGEKRRRITSLEQGSLKELDGIAPAQCVNYLRALAADQDRWQLHLDRLPVGLTPRQAIAALSADRRSPLVAHYRKKKVSSPVPEQLCSELEGART
jgi:hypothetical protein